MRAAAPDPNDSFVDELVDRSRGLMSGDIERSVVEPHLTGSPTYVPTHPDLTPAG